MADVQRTFLPQGGNGHKAYGQQNRKLLFEHGEPLSIQSADRITMA